MEPQPAHRPIVVATRGSALALTQTNMVVDQCRAAFPDLRFEIRIIKTTGDKQQTMSLTKPTDESTKGLFTKELEISLLNREADLAVHSLKDLPTELPERLILGAITKRADVRDVLIYRAAAASAADPSGTAKRGVKPHARITDFPGGATIATSSVRRQAQLLAVRSDLKFVPIRGNVGTRLRKLTDQADLDGMILAAAGLGRLGMRIENGGKLAGDEVPEGLLAVFLEPEQMLPCVGQGALGIEIRQDDPRIQSICDSLDHLETRQCVTAERSFLAAMGGGCLSPVAAYGEVVEGQLRLRAVSFQDGRRRVGEKRGPIAEAQLLGEEMARELGAC